MRTTRLSLLRVPAFILSFTLITGFGSLLHSATITYGPESLPFRDTDWATDPPPPLPQFDPSLGTLTGISFSLTGRLIGEGKVENLGAAPTSATSSFKTTIDLFDPFSNVVASTTLLNERTLSLAAFDGSLDYDGGSGDTHNDITESSSVTGSTALFAPFIGTGTVSLNVETFDQSTITSAGDIDHSISPQAAADFSITYTYNTISLAAAVPEPEAALPLAILLGLQLRRRRR